MNARKVVEDIHAKAARAAGSSGAGNSPGSPALESELALLHGACDRLYQMRGLVGQMPPAPDTLRARAGARMVRIVQRMLFWYTPQIHRVQHEATAAIGSLSRIIAMQQETIGNLRKEMRALQSSVVAAPTPAPAARSSDERPPALPPALEFALQDHFRGSEADTEKKLEGWLALIEEYSRAPGGAWFDAGCGRGEWLAMASRRGCRVSGVDANRIAVDYCRSQGFEAVEADLAGALLQTDDESLSVVTVFHVVEHLPFEYLSAVLSLAHRKLRPGGLIAIETPNPGNLQMGAHYFWNDPTHRRPVPEGLLTFLLGYAGFEIVKRIGLNPFPAANHLPYTEVDLVRQVDELLYGARDYGILGRK